MSRRTLSSSLFMVVAAAPLAFGACSSSKATTDAPIATIDAPAHTIDAAVHTIDAAVVLSPDAIVQAGCSYNEVADSTNDTTAEASGQTLTTAPITLCGSIAANTPDSTSGLVDTDTMTFTIATEGDYLLQLSAPTLDPTSQQVFLSLSDSMMNGDGSGQFFGGHAVIATHLTPDTYTFEMDALASAMPAAVIPYKLVISTDTPNTRCVNITTSADYVEAHDGTGNTGNDMVDVSWGMNGPTETVTTPTTDVPEPTALTLTTGGSKRITGVSANVTNTDDYFDRDSFNIAVGAGTNQLDIRINWTGTAADFDAFLFPAIGATDTMVQDVGGLTAESETSPEYGALAVTPSTNYTLWVGDFNVSTDSSGPDTTANTFPENYDITICASNYTAP